MKTTAVIAALFAFALLGLFSCQKEVSLENGARARYSFDGGTSSCLGATVSGTYTAGVPATSANTVTLKVTVDTIGSYTISTNAVNGLSFSASGVFTNTGAQTITLTAKGTPTVTGTYDFKPDPNACTFSVTVAANTGGAGGTASYSFTGGSSSCTDAMVNGTYKAGTATAASNTVVLKLNVTALGTYDISTNTTNGIKFSGTGNFTATGAQTVTLKASGTPTAAGSFAFTPGANACSFDVTVAASGGSGGGSGGSGIYLRCKINGVASNFNTDLIGYYVTPPVVDAASSISVQGKYSDVANSLIELWINASNPNAVTTGTYSNLTIMSGIADRGCTAGWYPNGFPNAYWSSAFLEENAFTVNITSVSTTGATGTFSGKLYENNGLGPATKTVTNGEFKITF